MKFINKKYRQVTDITYLEYFKMYNNLNVNLTTDFS